MQGRVTIKVKSTDRDIHQNSFLQNLFLLQIIYLLTISYLKNFKIQNSIKLILIQNYFIVDNLKCFIRAYLNKKKSDKLIEIRIFTEF